MMWSTISDEQCYRPRPAGAAHLSRIALLLGAGEEAAEVELAVELGDVC